MLAKLLKLVYPVKLLNWAKRYKRDIILFITVLLISLLSFATGYIVSGI